jgi:hypothetical protein
MFPWDAFSAAAEKRGFDRLRHGEDENKGKKEKERGAPGPHHDQDEEGNEKERRPVHKKKMKKGVGFLLSFVKGEGEKAHLQGQKGEGQKEKPRRRVFFQRKEEEGDTV